MNLWRTLNELKYRIIVASIIGVAIMATIFIIKPYRSDRFSDNGALSTTSLLLKESFVKE